MYYISLRLLKRTKKTNFYKLCFESQMSYVYGLMNTNTNILLNPLTIKGSV